MKKDSLAKKEWKKARGKVTRRVEEEKKKDRGGRVLLGHDLWVEFAWFVGCGGVSKIKGQRPGVHRGPKNDGKKPSKGRKQMKRLISEKASRRGLGKETTESEGEFVVVDRGEEIDPRRGGKP